VTPAAVLLARLERLRETGPGRWLARCPAHDDRHPSLSIRELPDGRVLVHCFAGCEAGDILAAVGLTLTDLFPDAGPHHSPASRGGIPAADILAALAVEFEITRQAAQRQAAGADLSSDDRERLARAAACIEAGLARVRGVRS